MRAFRGAIILLCLVMVQCSPAREAFPEAEERFLPNGPGVRVESWVENLEIPWSLVFLPEGRALVSERPGRIRLIEKGRLAVRPYAVLEVAHRGEGGLMGLALHPDFPRKPFIYAMQTYQKGATLFNRVVRLRDAGDRGLFDRVIIDGIPGGKYHDGGRIGFGPDGMLYITTGETFHASLAQDLKSLAGKILRVTPEGGIPADNPFPGSPVWSYGHRNPQGLAWDRATGTLFESEHGPSGEFLRFANDEINIIRKGGNYGWPEVIGRSESGAFISPLVLWETTTPPSGMTFYRGDLFVATLKSCALVRIRLKKDEQGYTVRGIERWFARDSNSGVYGRLRDVVEGPDGYLYFLTSNRDGRGSPGKGDDRIYRILPP